MPRNTKAPLLSVVIACFKQADPLDLVLESFLRQEYPHDEYEIIVVDDHSPDHCARVKVAEARRRYPKASIHYLRQHRSDGGYYRASAVVKNIGLRSASGQFVFFNNAEICQAGQTLAYLASRLTSSDVPLCLRGRVIDRPRSELENKTQGELEVLHDATDLQFERVASADHAGLAAVPRRLLIDVGGNDERFDHWGKEDLDLARRLKQAGAKYEYDERLKSFHVHHPANFQRQGDYRRMAVLLEESATLGVVEANIGCLWGQLELPPTTELEASVLVEGSADLDELQARLETLYYGPGAEKIEIAVAMRDQLRPAIETLIACRFKGLPLFALPEFPETDSFGRILRRLRADHVVISSSDCPPWSWGSRTHKSESGVVPLLASIEPPTSTARSGPCSHIPWLLDRETALRNLSHLKGFEELPAVLLNSASLNHWSTISSAGSTGSSARGPGDAADSVLALVPYLDCAAWLERCLASLVCQTRPPQAIALLLDGGDKPPQDLLERYPGITVFASEEIVGPYALIQAAIETSSYDWYMFQDADDWSTANRLESLLALATNSGAELVGSQEIRVFDEDGTAMFVAYPLDVNAALTQHPGHALLHPTSLVRRDLIMRVGGFATGFRFGGDTEFVLRAAHRARIVNCAEALYFRRSRPNSLTTAVETGLDSPVRKQQLSEMKNRARLNAARLSDGLPLDLAPCKVRPRIPLQYVSGPMLQR